MGTNVARELGTMSGLLQGGFVLEAGYHYLKALEEHMSAPMEDESAHYWTFQRRILGAARHTLDQALGKSSNTTIEQYQVLRELWAKEQLPLTVDVALKVAREKYPT
jgi:hypothetical protein